MRLLTTLSAVAAIGGLTLVACDRPAPTAADGAISADVTDGPAWPGGSHLIRMGEQEWVLSTSDPDAEMFTIYADPAETFDCGGPGGPEFSVQYNQFDVVMGRMRNLLGQGTDIPIYVYDFFEPEDLNGRTFCEYVEEEWKYRGTVHVIDMLHRNLVENNTAYQMTASGVVADVAGAPYSYNEVQGFIRAANGSFAAWLNERIHVTPRGGQ